MKYKIKQIEQLVNSNRAKNALNEINIIIKNGDEIAHNFNKEESISLLRLKAKCELTIFSDKSYLKTLNEISQLSEHLNDKLIYVHQLIKEKEYKKAHNEYEQLRNSNAIVIYKKNNQNRNQLLDVCGVFYADYSLHLLKEMLRNEIPEYGFDNKQKSRVNDFINDLFNVKSYEEQSLRHDHKPSYLGYASLNEEPYIEPKLISDIKLSSVLVEIKKEVLGILEKRHGTPYVKNKKGVPAGFDHLIENDSWRSIDVYAGGKLLVTEGKKLVSILKTHFDLADCPPLAPEVMISILEPGTHITPHYGTSNIKHTLHIPIVLPEGDLAIRVGGVLHRWKASECLLFDDSFEHEAWNRSKNTRIVLIVDIWHNELSMQERQFLKKIMPLIVDWRSKLNR